MTLDPLERLSVLACVSGLALTAIFFVVMLSGALPPEWLLLTISGIAGFELYMLLNAFSRRHAGDSRNG